MRRVLPFVIVSSLALVVAVAGANSQTAPAQPPSKPQAGGAQAAPPAAAEKATAVFTGNETCPGDNKPVNRDKFVEVEGQRVYVCCDNCVAALKKDAAAAKTALTKAYPEAKPVTAKNCACGGAIVAGKSSDVTFQGHKVTLCCADCATAFKKSPVTTMAMMMHPGSKDAKNATDPIDGKPIDGTILALYKNYLVHFSSWANEAAFEKDPAASFAKIKLSG